MITNICSPLLELGEKYQGNSAETERDDSLIVQNPGNTADTHPSSLKFFRLTKQAWDLSLSWWMMASLVRVDLLSSLCTLISC